MKLVVFCLFAVWCSSLGGTSSPLTAQRRKLKEVLGQLSVVRRILEHNEKMLNTPPQNVEDRCCLSALRCFRTNLNVHFDVTEIKQKKLYRSLVNENTERSLCNSTTSGDATCQDCDSHPKKTTREFFNRLESLIQKGIARLSMK
ncbi:interleukin-21 [Anarhichas minor]|uniref:interleukin-21 n=1 Tax=Anarhichas minor TaxID=65739 RepID=UPI003F7390D4